MRGRKPKPTALHKLEGTFNATDHKDRKREPQADGELLETPPDWMTPSQQAAWLYAVTHAPRGVMRRIDRGMLAIWVEAEDRHRIATVAQAALDRDTALPLLTKSKDGHVVVSPYVTVLTKAALVMIRAASELGFSPAARPRMATGESVPENDSPWAKLMVIDGGRAG